MSHQSAGLTEQIRRLLHEEVAPALELDPAQLEVLEFDRGCVRLRLTGLCASCPSTMSFLVRGIEDELRRRLPEVEYIEAVA